MADIVLPVVGGTVGFVLGGPSGAILGANLGSMAASTFFPTTQRVQLPTQEGPRLADLRAQTSTYGNMIPKVYGTMRLAGNVIWSTDIKEVKTEKTSTQTSSGGGKGGGGGKTTTSQTTVTYEYFVTLAIAICEGPVDEVIRVWADSKVLTEDVLSASQGKYNVHLGDETQVVDDIIAKYLTAGTIPAYRGMAYVVIEDFPLAEYGNRIPTVKTAVGSGVKVTYAADWSEYHSTGGWFNLDPLWASSNIDFVGIDSYFPITPDLPQIQIDEDTIKQYWEEGEGWDYFYADSVNRTGLTSYGGDPTYAWKNLEYWWANTHTNPDMSTTGWTAKMKPVWFTEFGFPSVDGAANQPNVFFDPTSSESFYPRGSKGRIDFQAQREALNATLDYLEERNLEAGNSDLVPRRFIWTWDARPFSFWPDLEGVWQDSILWATGHWVQGKLGNSTLGAIVAELLQAAGLTASDYDVTRLTDTVEGFILDRPITVRNAIEYLTTSYFFDIVESDGILKCVPRGNESVKAVPEDDLIPSKKKGVQDVLEIAYAQELELPRRVNVTYLDRPFNYDPVTQTSQRQVVRAVDQVTMSLPIVMGATLAKQISDITLYGTWKERTSFQLRLPPKYVRIEPTDIITITVNNVPHEMRVVKTDMEANGVMKVNAVAEDISSYDFYTPPGETSSNVEPPVLVPETLVKFVDAPPLPTDTVPNQGLLRIGVAADGPNWNGSAVYRSDDGGEAGGNTFNLLAGLDGAATFGAITTNLPAGTFETWDNVNEAEVILTSGSLASISELGVLNGANAALIGDELIQFQNAELIGESTYKLTKLLRGRQGTEWAIDGHAAGDRFVLITPALYTTAIANNLIGRELYYKAVSVGNTLTTTDEEAFTYTGRNLKPFAPVHVEGSRDGSDNLTIDWIRRSRVDSEWRDGVGIQLA